MSRSGKNAWHTRNEDAANAYITNARALVKSKRTEDAIHSYQQALALVPRNARLHAELGQLLARKKRTAQAIEMLQRSLELDPRHVAAQVALGKLYNHQDQPDKAEPLLLQALEQEPENASAHLVMGVIRHHQNRLPEALSAYRQALRLRLAKPISQSAKPRRKDFNQPEVEQLMWATLAQLAKAGVHAFAAYGTLLGLTREGSLLPFDKDIDFGLPHCEMPRATHCLLRNGWIEPSGAQRLSNPKAFYHPLHKVSLDLSGFVVDGQGQTYTGFWLAEGPREWHRQTRYPTLHLKQGATPAGEAVWQLEHADAWLTAVYGDWRTPDAFFDTVIAAKNLCGFSLLTECYAISRIYSHIDSGAPRKAWALAGHALNHRPADPLLLDARRALDEVI